MTRGAVGGQTGGRPLRIAMISQYLPSGSKIGVGYWVDQLGRSLCRRGHEVTIFTACPAMQDAPYRTRTISLSGALRTFRFAEALRREGLERFDVLHAHGDDYLLWGRRPAAHVRTMHGSCFAEALHIRGPKERARMLALGVTELLATAVADRTFVVSPATRAWMPWVRGVLPCGVDRSRLRRAESVAPEQVPTVLFVGTWHRRKRGALLAEAFQRHVLPVLPEARLWMVAEDCPGGPGIVPMGRVSDEALVELYGRAWVFCLPSSYEGLGIPYVEALAAGLPVVATSNPGSRYVLDGGRAGWIVGEEDLGPALLRLLTDSAERARLAEAGRRRSAEFDLERVVDHYERTYRELLERGRASRSLGPELAEQGIGGPHSAEPAAPADDDGRKAVAVDHAASLQRPPAVSIVQQREARGGSGDAARPLRLAAYVLLGDPAFLSESIGSYYDAVDRIVAAYDVNARSWSGDPLPVDRCLQLVREVDRDRKVELLAGEFSRPGRPAMESETAERRAALAALGDGVDWIVQLDTDEVLADLPTFLDALDRAQRAGATGLEYPARWLYGEVAWGRGRVYLEACSRRLGLAASYPGPVAVRPGTELVHARQARAQLWRVDFSSHNTDPHHPPDARVDQVIGARQGIWHFSWVRPEAELRAKSRVSGHAADFDWERTLEVRADQLAHPLRTTLLTPFRHQRDFFGPRYWLRPVWVRDLGSARAGAGRQR